MHLWVKWTDRKFILLLNLCSQNILWVSPLLHIPSESLYWVKQMFFCLICSCRMNFLSSSHYHHHSNFPCCHRKNSGRNSHFQNHTRKIQKSSGYSFYRSHGSVFCSELSTHVLRRVTELQSSTLCSQQCLGDQVLWELQFPSLQDETTQIH